MGGFDTLCHCAGILRTYHTHEMTFEQWHQIIDINLNGTFYVNQAALPHLLKNRFSALVNCSSHFAHSEAIHGWPPTQPPRAASSR